jgi:hypothetical protein
MRGRQFIFGVCFALLAIAGSVAPAFALVPIDSSGTPGAWSIADSSTDAALRCTYDGSNLTSVTIAPPTIYGRSVRKRMVGWEVDVLRLKWWQSIPDTNQWYVAYASGITKGLATKTKAAAFVPQTWAIPDGFKTGYDSIKVQVVVHWYARNRVREIGHVTSQLEYYGVEQAGQPFDPTTDTFGPGACVGSTGAPQLPADLGTRAALPAGMVRMSHWRPYWQGASATTVQGYIATLTAMHQTGVILTGMESGNKYALPADVANYLTMFRNAGITPYLVLWMGKFDSGETATAMKAWNAGNGQWGGVVLDVEAGLMHTVQSIGRSAAEDRVAAFMTQMRSQATFIAFSSMAIPSDYPDMLYSKLNELSDAFMPQVYFHGTGATALRLLDGMQASINYESKSWSAPPKPIIPVVNDWGDNVNVDQLNLYIQIAFERYGAVSGWRLHPNMHQEVKDLWATFDP